MWGRGVLKYRSFRMCLNLHDYQFKASRYCHGSAYLNSMIMEFIIHSKTLQKTKIKHSQKTKMKGTHAHNKRKSSYKNQKEMYKNYKTNWETRFKWQ